jgi:acetyltransferase
MELAEEITKKKPIILIKAGKGERGQQAVMSHTGSLAPEDAVFSAACKQSGIIVVQSIREFFNMAKLLELKIFKPLQKMIVLTNAGGPAVVASDLIESSHSLSLIEFSEETIGKLKKSLPPMAAFNNPVDIIGDALSSRYEIALKILIEEREADAIIVIVTPQMMTEAEKTAELIVKYNAQKTIIPVFIGGANLDAGLKILQENNLVNFTFPKDAVEALDDMACNALKIERPKVARKLGAGSLEIEKMMSFGDTRKLFSEFDLSISGIFIKEKSELKDTINKLGGDRFILKTMSPDVVHKTEMGAVKLNIKSFEEAEKAWDEMLVSIKDKKPDAVIDGVLVQKKALGKEIIIGMKKDPIFGPTVLFGLGGIFTEALKDTSIRIAPISKEVAQKMIHEIHGINILTGLRGEKPIDFESIADVIVKISKLAMEHPEIIEIDLNPVMVRSNEAEIVDARVMVNN